MANLPPVLNLSTLGISMLFIRTTLVLTVCMLSCSLQAGMFDWARDVVAPKYGEVPGEHSVEYNTAIASTVTVFGLTPISTIAADVSARMTAGEAPLVATRQAVSRITPTEYLRIIRNVGVHRLTSTIGCSVILTGTAMRYINEQDDHEHPWMTASQKMMAGMVIGTLTVPPIQMITLKGLGYPTSIRQTFMQMGVKEALKFNFRCAPIMSVLSVLYWGPYCYGPLIAESLGFENDNNDNLLKDNKA